MRKRFRTVAAFTAPLVVQRACKECADENCAFCNGAGMKVRKLRVDVCTCAEDKISAGAFVDVDGKLAAWINSTKLKLLNSERAEELGSRIAVADGDLQGEVDRFLAECCQ